MRRALRTLVRLLLVAAMACLLSCGDDPEKESASACVTLQCNGNASGWTNCYYACGACIYIARAVVVTEPDVCSF